MKGGLFNKVHVSRANVCIDLKIVHKIKIKEKVL